jgi:predicted metal-dependent HD superfamily phosphohydrolase
LASSLPQAGTLSAASDPLPMLRAAFAPAWSGLGARGDAGCVRDELLACYAQPHRRYHTLQHLAECIETFRTASALAQHAAEIEIALWFHDAIYDPRSSDNEERSAAWARRALDAAEVPRTVAERVHALVIATCHTALPAAGDPQLLVDVDLSILGAAEQRFAEYERQIRGEYSFVPEAIFRRRRREILQAFLDRPRLYGTAHFHAALENRARANLLRALS